MLYRFIERLDDVAVEVAKVDVNKDSIAWNGSGANEIRDLLINTKWQQLNDKVFDENNSKHWKILPELLSGSRLWVEVQ